MEKVKKVIKGSFGTSSLAVDGDPPIVGLIKDFPAEYFPTSEVRAAFLREVQAWVGLGRHPNLLTAFSVGERERGVRLVTEYIPPDELGLNSLQGRLERHPLESDIYLRWAVEACLCMEYAASRGLRCHGDLRPANFYIGTDGTLRVGGWGLARALSLVGGLAATLRLQGGAPALSFAGPRSFGTPSYMAPEQFDDATACDARSDVYSFGIVLFQLAHHALPFRAPPPQDRSGDEFQRYWTEMRRQHREVEPTVPFDPLYTIMMRCLEKDPTRRYQSFAELRGDLEGLLGADKRPRPGPEADRAVVRALGLLDVRALSAALAAFDQALSLEPDNETALRGRARTLANLGRFDEALASADRVVALLPQSAQAQVLRGRALAGLGRHDEALASFDRALELDPTAGNALFRRGVVLRGMGRLDHALQALERAIALVPGQGDYLREAGRTFQAMGLHKDALEAHAKACELMPLESRFWTDQGAALLHLDRLEESIVCFDRALALDEHNDTAWSDKGSALSKQGFLSEGQACFEKAVQLDPNNPTPWFAKGVVQKDQGDAAGAIASLERFLALAGAETSARVDAAREILEKLGAASGLGLGSATPPEVAELVHNAIDFVAARRFNEAVICYTKALEFDPNNGKVWAMRAELHLDLGQIEEARADDERSLALSPNGADGTLVKGRLLAAGGEHEGALQCYARALALQPKASVVLLHQARSLDALGRRVEAVRSLERFVALGGAGDKARLDEALALLKDWQAR